MKTLFEHYQALRRSYYGICIDAAALFSPVSGKEECRRFIDKHFEKGSKEEVCSIPDSFREEYDLCGKHQHTVSLYLLGLCCKDLFSERIKSRMRELFDVKDWYQYEYTWYLTCLYHDVTSVEEKNRRFVDYADIGNSKLFEQDEKLLRFSKELYTNYVEYRKKDGSSEHGIIAGTALFDRLYKSFQCKTEDHNLDKERVYEKNGLVWRKEHIQHFAYIADAVCCHNIWLASENDEERCEKYRKAGLGTLIVNSESDKLSFAEYPLQFVLCLLDTIEPIKRFENLSAYEVLNNIYLDIRRDGLTLGWTDLLKKQPQFSHWMESVSTVDGWMQVHKWPSYITESQCTMSLAWEGILSGAAHRLRPCAGPGDGYHVTNHRR